jgi:hypothetical protein
VDHPNILMELAILLILLAAAAVAAKKALG